jgi:hypothetical protein
MITAEDFKIEEYDVDKFVVTLLTSDDVGIKYYYEDVAFDEKTEDCYLNFGYKIVSGTPNDVEKFQKRIGDILVFLIEQMLKSKELVYANGTE